MINLLSTFSADVVVIIASDVEGPVDIVNDEAPAMRERVAADEPSDSESGSCVIGSVLLYYLEKLITVDSGC